MKVLVVDRDRTGGLSREELAEAIHQLNEMTTAITVCDPPWDLLELDCLAIEPYRLQRMHANGYMPPDRVGRAARPRPPKKLHVLPKLRHVR